MMTTEGWTTVMFNGVDAVGIDKQPKENHQLWFALYFIIFMVVGFLFLMNLFVGVIIDNFNKIKEQKEVGGIFVTESQRNWIEIQRTMLARNLIKKEFKPKNRIRRFFYEIQANKYFDFFIIMCIFMNTIVMAMQYARMSDTYGDAIEGVNLAFAIIFNLEMIIKLIALCHKYFTHSSWNRFDFAIVMGTDIGLIFNAINIGIDISTTATVARAFRIMRIFRLLKSYGRVVLDTLVKIIPQITNIMCLIFLLLFIYSVLGISLFADVKYGKNYNKNNNFRNFPQSIVLLFRCMTGEDWNLIMDDLVNTDNCQSNQSYDDIQANGVQGCGSWYAYAYFISFMIVLQMIIINLTVAAVIDGLSSARKDNSGVIKKDEINDLFVLWAEYDPYATGWIDVTNLTFLLFELPKPMGFGKDRELLALTKVEEDQRDINDILQKTIRRRNKLRQKVMQKKPSAYNHSLFEINSDNSSSGGLRRLDTIKEETNKKDDSLTNFERKITLNKVEAIKILESFDIPYYENKKVHFKDICKKVVENSFLSKKQNVEVGKRLRKHIKRGWHRKYNLTKHKKINVDVQKIMAATLLLKWIRVYRSQKLKRTTHLGVDQGVDMLEKHISKSLAQSFSQYSIDEEAKDNASDKDIPIYKPNEGDKSPFSKNFFSRVDSKLGTECNKFIKSNPELFETIAKKDDDSQLNKKKIKRPTTKKSQFHTILPPLEPLNRSLLLDAVGGFFHQKEDHKLESRREKMKQLEKRKLERQMRSTAVLAKNHSMARLNNSKDKSYSDKDSYYSYQQIDKNEIYMDD